MAGLRELDAPSEQNSLRDAANHAKNANARRQPWKPMNHPLRQGICRFQTWRTIPLGETPSRNCSMIRAMTRKVLADRRITSLRFWSWLRHRRPNCRHRWESLEHPLSHRHLLQCRRPLWHWEMRAVRNDTSLLSTQVVYTPGDCQRYILMLYNIKMLYRKMSDHSRLPNRLGLKASTDTSQCFADILL